MSTANESKVSMLPPSIEIIWGGDRWTDRQQGVLGPNFRSALDLAQLGLEAYGLIWEGPKKATLQRLYRNEFTGSAAGLCYGEDGFTVNVLKRHVRASNEDRFFRHFSKVSAHELTHCIRHENYREDTLLERCASEGLALSIESSLSQDFFGLEINMMLRLGDLGVGELEDLHALTLKDAQACGSSSAELSAKWFGDRGYGYLVGAWCVSRQLDEGASIAEIIQMSAAQIMEASQYETAA